MRLIDPFTDVSFLPYSHIVSSNLPETMHALDMSRSSSEDMKEEEIMKGKEAMEIGAAHGPAPDGGLRAWLVSKLFPSQTPDQRLLTLKLALGGFLNYFATFGGDTSTPYHDHASNTFNRTVELFWDISDLLSNPYPTLFLCKRHLLDRVNSGNQSSCCPCV